MAMSRHLGAAVRIWHEALRADADPIEPTSRWLYYGQEHVVHALKPIDDAPEGSSRFMVLVSAVGVDPHPCDWWPETSFRREFQPVR
jgi:hypothetical protein